MFNPASVKTRFLVSIASNGMRSVISFACGLLIARGLNPAGYGDLMFLLGSFVAIRSLLDMGTSSAFYTILSRRSQGSRFYFFYFSWLALQFLLTLSLVALIIPDDLFERIWLGHSRVIVIIAFLATFMQQQAWQTVSQIGESKRMTVKVQLLNLCIALSYLAIVALLLLANRMTVENILFVIIGQYLAATFFAHYFLREKSNAIKVQESTLSETVEEYWTYCKPLFLLAVVAFLYDFADKWMLQHFAGSAQQGYFQIANQFSTVSLLATTSILSIFWKEIADAWEQQDRERSARLYKKISRGLVMLGAIVTGLLLPWSKQIVAIFLGPAYVQAWPVLAIMFLYPIHQSMGQIGGTMLLATGKTHKYMVVSIGIMLASIPLSYFMLAPESGMIFPGLGMGASGIALKMVILGVVSVNIQAWVIARYNGWKLDWIFQVIGIPLMIGLGYFSKMSVGFLWDLDSTGLGELISPVILSSFVYVTTVMLVVWLRPDLMGLNKEDLRKILKSPK